MAREILALLVLAVVVGCVAGAEVSDKLDWLPEELKAEAFEMMPSFEQIEAQLESSGVNGIGSLMERIEKMSKPESGFFSSLICSQKNQCQSEEAAFKLLLSLPEAAKSCDFASYETLAMVHAGLKAELAAPDSPRKAIVVYRDFARQHAEHCKSHYKTALVEAVESAAEHNNYLKIKALLEDTGLDQDSVESKKEKYQIARRVLHKLLEAQRPHSFEEAQEGVREKVVKMLTEQLVGPCEKLYNKLEETAAPAAFDLASESSGSEDADMKEILLYFRFCSYAAKESDIIYRMSNSVAWGSGW